MELRSDAYMKTTDQCAPGIKISEIIRELCVHTGVKWNYYREKHILRRLEHRMQRCKISQYGEYLERLKNDRLEARQLTDSIGINVSSFFRDRQAFELLGTEIFPRLIEKKRTENSGRLHVWSAGCATGEEPYSVSMILNELQEKDKRGLKLTITATDIDETALEFARKGRYTAEKILPVNDRLMRKYFTMPNEKTYEASKIIKDNVKFRNHDIISFPPVSMVDIILCRNMLIYIKPEYQLPIFEKFYSALPPGGFLVLGKSEAMPGEFYGKFKAHNQSEKIYFKC